MDDLTVKLTDYALSSDLFPQDYETLRTDQNEERRPWKFMALESISERRFSTASDVVRVAIPIVSLPSFSLCF